MRIGKILVVERAARRLFAGRSRGSRVIGAAVLAAAIASARPAHAQVQQSDFICSFGAVYNLTWDGCR